MLLTSNDALERSSDNKTQGSIFSTKVISSGQKRKTLEKHLATMQKILSVLAYGKIIIVWFYILRIIFTISLRLDSAQFF